MAKLIKLEGVNGEIVVKECNSCPFNRNFCGCGLKDLVDVIFDGFPKDCPLPDYIDENEHTAPDGTVLVAVESVNMDCKGCHYDKNGKCTCEEGKNPCIPSERRDKRFVIYAPKNKQEVK